MVDDVLEIACGVHGNGVAATVCGHLVNNMAVPLGFVENSDLPNDLQGWCYACEYVFLREEDKTEKFRAFNRMSVVCAECYSMIKNFHCEREQPHLCQVPVSSNYALERTFAARKSLNAALYSREAFVVVMKRVGKYFIFGGDYVYIEERGSAKYLTFERMLRNFRVKIDARLIEEFECAAHSVDVGRYPFELVLKRGLYKHCCIFEGRSDDRNMVEGTYKVVGPLYLYVGCWSSSWDATSFAEIACELRKSQVVTEI